MLNPSVGLPVIFHIPCVQPPVAHIVYKCYLPAVAESVRDVKVGGV